MDHRQRFSRALGRTLLVLLAAVVLLTPWLQEGATPRSWGAIITVAAAQWLVVLPWTLVLLFRRAWATVAGLWTAALLLLLLAGALFAVLPGV